MRSLLATALAALGACTGAVDDGSSGDGSSGDGSDGEPAQVDIIGPAVLPHVQQLANAICGVTGACTIGTRAGHHPTADRAIDILVSDAFGEAATAITLQSDEIRTAPKNH